jgi:hypothetical protein
MARKRKSRKGTAVLPVLHLDAAGIDIGATEIYVAVPADRDHDSVRVFQTFTEGLMTLADLLHKCRIRTVAMESTGVYWIPLMQILESRGLEVFLVNARYTKDVPGRKTDVSDCQWLQYLHSVGIIEGLVSPGSSCMCCSITASASGQPGGTSEPTCAAYAKGIRPNESPATPRDRRLKRNNRIGDYGRHSRWRA